MRNKLLTIRMSEAEMKVCKINAGTSKVSDWARMKLIPVMPVEMDAEYGKPKQVVEVKLSPQPKKCMSAYCLSTMTTAYLIHGMTAYLCEEHKP